MGDIPVEVIHGRPYHPQSQGSVENANKFLIKRLGSVMRITGSLSWWLLLPYAVMLVNCNFSRRLKGSAYGYLFGGTVFPPDSTSDGKKVMKALLCVDTAKGSGKGPEPQAKVRRLSDGTLTLEETKTRTNEEKKDAAKSKQSQKKTQVTKSRYMWGMSWLMVHTMEEEQMDDVQKEEERASAVFVAINRGRCHYYGVNQHTQQLFRGGWHDSNKNTNLKRAGEDVPPGISPTLPRHNNNE